MIEAEAAGSTLSVEMTREDFISAAAASYDAIVHALQRARPSLGPLHLRVSHRWATLPGFLERLEALRDCEARPLPRGAGALGALACERTLRRDTSALVLVQRLPVPLLAAAAATAVANQAVPAGERPTHAIYRSRAHEIRAVPLVIGVSIPAGQRALAVPAGPGISRVHCALWRDGDGVWLEDRSTYGTYLNGARIGGRVALALGDRLRIGSPGVELELVRAVDDDGAT